MVRELTLWSFVAAEVLLGLGEHNVLAELRAILLQAQLFRRVHRVLGGVIDTLATLLAEEADDLTLIAFFGHSALPYHLHF